MPGTDDVDADVEATTEANVCPFGGAIDVGDKTCCGCCCWLVVPFGTVDDDAAAAVVDDDDGNIGYDATLVSGNLSFFFGFYERKKWTRQNRNRIDR